MRATSAVGDRSLLTELLAILLVANFVWPCAGYGSAGISSGPMRGHAESPVARAGLGVRSRDYKPFPGRRVSTPRGVLDDDPAILYDDSDDWIEGSTRLVPPPVAEAARSSFPVTVLFAGLTASRAAPHTARDFLGSFRC